ncbi:MAG: MBL fold metallo-hydrolase [Candidatus Levybacteria bacterium]|nr:MBL fold metallo-hydrolase [Candidatus Levybacteria bacterium]
MKIEFLGASGGEVTGSNYLVTLDDTNQILVDFGMFQGRPEIEKHNFEPLSFNPSTLQAVFLTHAHLDHCGRLPLLVFGGFKGKIYMTKPTASLVQIILEDAARIAEKDRDKSPLYTTDEVWKTIKMIEIVSYDHPILLKSLKAEFKDAGHILGSSSIKITDNESKKSIIFSGDLGNSPQSIVKPTDYFDNADAVVMESTYGDSSHPKENPAKIIQEEINEIENKPGTLLIPAFALERTQEILHIINHLKKDKKVHPDTKVFLDSPMGIDATTVYLDFKDFYNEELQSHIEIPFNFEGAIVTSESKDSKNILHEPDPKVIIAGSGMMSGGRILRHATTFLPRSSTRILFVGYQSEETIGRKILEGAKNVRIEKQSVTVRAHIREIKALSSHADQPKLITWLEHIATAKKVYLTHGELPQQHALQKKISKAGLEIFLPKMSEVFEI